MRHLWAARRAERNRTICYQLILCLNYLSTPMLLPVSCPFVDSLIAYLGSAFWRTAKR